MVESATASSRDLLMTVLGELVLPNERHAWTQTLVAAMDLLDVQEKATRQALSRMDDRGWLERSRHGRQTRWHLTGASHVLLDTGAQRIYGFGDPDRSWDGRWLMLLASVPERDRSTRYRMGVGLRWAGFGSLGQGTWISPWVDREAQAVDVLGNLGVEATSFRAELGELGSGTSLADSAWDLPELRAEYDTFLRETAHLTGATVDGPGAVAELTQLVHRWRRFPLVDPDLPAELLPSDWPGAAAATRFRDLRARLLTPATAWWTETDAAFG